jgi:two-component system cell cycle response regulator
MNATVFLSFLKSLATILPEEEAQLLLKQAQEMAEELEAQAQRIASLERKLLASKKTFETAVAAHRSLLETFQTFRHTIDRILQMNDLQDVSGVMEAIRHATHLTMARVVLDADLFGSYLPPDVPAASGSVLRQRLQFLEDGRGRLIPYIGAARNVEHPAFFLGLDLVRQGSCVIFPLRHKYDPNQTIGVFCAFDTDPTRFSRSKATDFLEHFCAILGASLITALEHAELDALTVRDALTGIHNRAYLERHAPRLMELAQRKNRPMQLLFLDLDGFKTVNDRLGHDAGDMVLCEVAQILASSVRAYDICVRLGGDEFAILMPEAEATDALALTRRLQEAIQSIHIPAVNTASLPIRVSASIGIASWKPGEDLDSLLRQADAAMYAVKARR